MASAYFMLYRRRRDIRRNIISRDITDPLEVYNGEPSLREISFSSPGNSQLDRFRGKRSVDLPPHKGAPTHLLQALLTPLRFYATGACVFVVVHELLSILTF